MATITFYGTRGSTAYDSIDNKVFGGNTACVGVETGNGLVLFDAGTGLLAAEKDFFVQRPAQVALAFSHAHHDHIEGLPISKLPYIPGTNVCIIGSKRQYDGLASRCNVYNFPVSFTPERMAGIDFGAAVTLPLEERTQQASVTISGMRLDAMMGNHPGGSVMYRLWFDNKPVVYATDQEFDYAVKGDARLALNGEFRHAYEDFIAGAVVLIADAQYTKEEYHAGKPDVRGWGHSYPEQVLDMAARAGVKHIIITHHDPRRTDEQLMTMEKHAQAYCAQQRYSVSVAYARQGMRCVL